MEFLLGMTCGGALISLVFLPFTRWLQCEITRQDARYQMLRDETDILREKVRRLQSDWIAQYAETRRD